MSLISLIYSYGYIAVFFGGIFEGEAILILGGLGGVRGLFKTFAGYFFRAHRRNGGRLDLVFLLEDIEAKR